MNLNLPSGAEINFQEPVHLSLRISVIVPAKNEADFIVSTLDALRMQIDGYGERIDYGLYEVLVLANNCDDDTYEICRSYQAMFPDFQLYVSSVKLAPDIAHIGTVRRLLMDAAYCRLISVAGPLGIIVSTDGDSEVDAQWIYHILNEMDKGVDVVGGRILPREMPSLSKIHHLRDVTYRFLRTRLEAELDPCLSNPWPRHFQCYGPSMAVTCDIYERAGRLPVIPYLEDEEFRKALKRIDAKIRHAPNVRIYTSSRLEGRVGFGFSVQLQQWGDMSLKREQQMVESLESLRFQLELKKELRGLWSSVMAGKKVLMNISALACRLNFEGEELLSLLNKSVYFESLWEQIEKKLIGVNTAITRLQPIAEAIRDLRHHFSLGSRSNKHIILNRQKQLEN